MVFEDKVISILKSADSMNIVKDKLLDEANSIIESMIKKLNEKDISSSVKMIEAGFSSTWKIEVDRYEFVMFGKDLLDAISNNDIGVNEFVEADFLEKLKESSTES